MSNIEVEIVGIRGGSRVSHSAISAYKWVQYDSFGRALYSNIWDRQTMVNWKKENGHSAYVKDQFRDKAYCEVRREGTTEFLQTYADRIWTDNLLSLPQI